MVSAAIERRIAPQPRQIRLSKPHFIHASSLAEVGGQMRSHPTKNIAGLIRHDSCLRPPLIPGSVSCLRKFMALKAIIYKAVVQLSDMDRNIYGDYPLTIARHPSETDERMLIRLLAFALNVPADKDDGVIEFAKDMWDADEPALWHKDLTGQIKHWIEVGQPDDKRLLRTTSRVGRVSVYSFSASTPVWWRDIKPKLDRARNLSVWQIPADQSRVLAGLAQRSMELQVTVQDGAIWVGDGGRSIEVEPLRLGGLPNPA